MMTNADKLKNIRDELLVAFKTGLLREDDCNRIFGAIRNKLMELEGPFGQHPPDFKSEMPQAASAPIIPGEQDAFKTEMPWPSAAPIDPPAPPIEQDEFKADLQKAQALPRMTVEEAMRAMRTVAKDFAEEELEEGEAQEIPVDASQKPITIQNCNFNSTLGKKELKTIRALAKALVENASAVKHLAKRLQERQPMVYIGNRTT